MEKVKLICTKDLSQEFMSKWHIEEEMMYYIKKGWETWATKEDEILTEDGTILLEDNKWRINFPRENFKKI